MQNYHATFHTPHTVLGITTEDDAVTGIDFLPLTSHRVNPQNAFVAAVVEQLARYLINPKLAFDLPLNPRGTPHQTKVWRAMQAIPVGRVRTYGDIAREIGSSPRAVGQACGANPIPVIIPCHRVVGQSSLGGFMHSRESSELTIKAWLLGHEQSEAHAA